MYEPGELRLTQTPLDMIQLIKIGVIGKHGVMKHPICIPVDAVR